MNRLFVSIFILLLPLIEIAGFIVVGRQIGVLPTIGLVMAAVLAGVVLLRFQGLGAIARIRRASETGAIPGRELADGAMIMLAGILLVVPGFVTDIMGLLLFIGPVRTLVWRYLGSRITVVTATGFGGRARRADDMTIDLAEDEYSRAKPADSLRSRIGPGKDR